MSFLRTYLILAAAFALASFPAPAQSTASAASGDTLDQLIVTSTPLGGSLDEQSQPVSILGGDRLQLKLQSSLGETLSGEPGVSSTYYGPGASRPVIRGFDGERIKILQNGTATLDASAASVDHAVTVQPINVDHIEVVRGPATLLYGTSAVGGIVNVIDNRIPNQLLNVPITGTTDLRYKSVGGERAAAALIEGGANGFVYHLDGFKRNAHNIEIPSFARSERLREEEPREPGELEPKDKLPNSAIDEQGASAGASYLWTGGYFGAAYSGLNSNYGTVGEPEVTIGLRQQRIDVAGAFNQPFSGVDSIKYKAAISDYQHIEYEAHSPGTTFENEGYDTRIDFQQAKSGLLEGAFGLQSQKSDFSALGEEAFLPPTETLIQSAFVFEQIDLAPVSLQFGGRLDLTSVEADDNPAFGPGRERDFDTFGLSAGALYRIADAWSTALTLSYTERAPTQQELFADGPHVATLAFEVGDPDLSTENSAGVDLTLRKTAGVLTGSLSLFYNHFEDFVSLDPSGEFFPGEEEDLAIYNYTPVEATFLGGEFQGVWHLLAAPSAPAAAPLLADGKSAPRLDKESVPPLAATAPAQAILDLEVRADYVRAEDEENDQPLPRIPPLRIGAGLAWSRGPLGVRIDADHYFDQHRHDPDELETDGYTLVSASVTYRFNTGSATSEIFLRGTNLLGEEARTSTSFLKDVAPLAGRGIEAGLQISF